MGSISAMKEGSKDRYGQEDTTQMSKLVPEGIEGRVPYRGSLATSVYQLIGGLRSGMGYLGVKTLEELRIKGQFVKVTYVGHKEGHVHNVFITQEAPNYRMSDSDAW
jgi:IMP dehydrogenase